LNPFHHASPNNHNASPSPPTNDNNSNAEEPPQKAWLWMPTPNQSPDPDEPTTGPAVRDGLQRFCNMLFEDDATGRWSPKARELLVSSLFLRCEQFCNVLRKHPGACVPEATFESWNPWEDRFHLDRSCQCNSIKDNLFVCRVLRALEKAEVPKWQFNSWCKCARSAFLERNVHAMPSPPFPLCGEKGKKMLMDPRCFANHMDAIASFTQSTHVIVHNLRHQVDDLRELLLHERNLNEQNFQNQPGLAACPKDREPSNG